MSDRRSLMEQGFVKIKLTSEDGIVETVWAVRIGEGRFEIRNSPWYVYGVSEGDVVEGVEYAPNMYEFTRVVEPSGNRTIRLILSENARADSDAGKAVLAELNALGCSYENMNDSMISVVVPPNVKLSRVATFLVDTGLSWEYANPTYDELFG